MGRVSPRTQHLARGRVQVWTASSRSSQARGSARRSTSTPMARGRRSSATASPRTWTHARTRSILLVGEAPGYRGARVSGHPVHVRAPADRRRPGRGDRDDRPPRPRGARDRGRRAALERRADASRHRDHEQAADRGRGAPRPRVRTTACRGSTHDRRRPRRVTGARAPVRPSSVARRRDALRPRGCGRDGASQAA